MLGSGVVNVDDTGAAAVVTAVPAWPVSLTVPFTGLASGACAAAAEVATLTASGWLAGDTNGWNKDVDTAACGPDTGPAVVVGSFRVDGPEGANVSRGLADSLAAPLACSGAKVLPEEAGTLGGFPLADNGGAVKLKAAAADTAAGDDNGGALVFPNRDFAGAVPAWPKLVPKSGLDVAGLGPGSADAVLVPVRKENIGGCDPARAADDTGALEDCGVSLASAEVGLAFGSSLVVSPSVGEVGGVMSS